MNNKITSGNRIKNLIYENYNKIISKNDFFDQFPDSINKDNIYIGKKLTIGFSKK